MNAAKASFENLLNYHNLTKNLLGKKIECVQAPQKEDTPVQVQPEESDEKARDEQREEKVHINSTFFKFFLKMVDMGIERIDYIAHMAIVRRKNKIPYFIPTIYDSLQAYPS